LNNRINPMARRRRGPTYPGFILSTPALYQQPHSNKNNNNWPEKISIHPGYQIKISKNEIDTQ
ncbi:MAG: hypothetical protein QSU88_06185, partial [Candidatus Methanoperedens sp.]|nr:hypothetical protein [Candidatus Methanoperedens sp.]